MTGTTAKTFEKARVGYYGTVRDYLRENALQVKMFEIDTNFTGKITCHERQSYKTKPGYKAVKREFDSFDELKKYYGEHGEKRSKRSTKTTRKPRKSVKKTSAKAKTKLVAKKPKRAKR